MKRIFIEKESGRIFSEDEYKKFWEEESSDPNNHHYQQHFEDYVYEKCHEKNCPDIEAWTCDGTDELAMEIVRNLNYCKPVYSDFSKEEFDPFAILEGRPESRLAKLASACCQFETDLKTALNAFNEAKRKCL